MHSRIFAAVLGTAGLAAGVVGLSVANASSEAGRLPGATTASAETYNVDGTHTSVVFRVEHLGVSHFYGRFNEVSGTFSLDEEDPSSSSIDMTVVAESVDTNSTRRDNHLRSPDFFNAKQFPEITFTSTDVSKDSYGNFVVEGDFTLLGVTKPVTVKVRKTGEGETPMGQRAGFETTFEIDRSAYGMSWGIDNGALGDEVRLMVAVEGTKG